MFKMAASIKLVQRCTDIHLIAERLNKIDSVDDSRSLYFLNKRQIFSNTDILSSNLILAKNYSLSLFARLRRSRTYRPALIGTYLEGFSAETQLDNVSTTSS